MHVNEYTYFDEAYFQDGKQRGTAYSNYAQGSRDSKTFQEIAKAIMEVFRPRRVLDVGCATGAIVRWLNELGCEAHGVDVSDWAVRNAQHPNVQRSSADSLPFADGFFDLVISCHAMEHLPDPVFDRSLVEISRVTSAFHFHLLPMVGTSPYDGEPAEVRRQLKKDPTHQQLHSKEYWIQRFQQLGCVSIETCILFKNENVPPELSAGQFLLKKSASTDDSAILGRSRQRNQQIFLEVQRIASAQRAGRLGIAAAGTLTFQERAWKDLDRKLHPSDRLDLSNKLLQLVVIVRGNPGSLRLAVGQDAPDQAFSDVGEFVFPVKTGCNAYSFSTDHLRTLRGTPDYTAVSHLALGGENENCKMLFYLADQHGTSLLG
jgi:SAM-dependent methyltransferase